MDDIPAEKTNHIDNRHLSGMAAAQLVAGSSNWNGIRANLAEMERKLGELQQQVDPAQRPSAAPRPLLPDLATTPAAHAQVAQAKQQIEELLRVREMLRESLRGTISECERMLGQLDRGEPVSPALSVGSGDGDGDGDSETLAAAALAPAGANPALSW